MDRLPFGVSRLDRIIGGGSPPGTVVLLAGEAGAGAREFLYTAAVINGLAHTDEEQFDLHYGSLHENAQVPEEIRYVSFTANEDELRRELTDVIDDEIVTPAMEAITYEDLSSKYFQMSPVPRSWYAGERQTISELGDRDDRHDVLEALGDSLDEHASNNLVLIDSLSDLTVLADDHLSWSDISLLVRGLQKAARSWNGLILVHVNTEGLTSEELGRLVGSTDGTILFEWSAGGNELDRTMVVKEFRGVLPVIEEEDIVRFETEIHEAGLDISNVRKIR
ncbi:MAG: HTR-like protein [Halobacteriales archaeon]|nr:HTR-like protein [Halobacteriales archaeon]